MCCGKSIVLLLLRAFHLEYTLLPNAKYFAFECATFGRKYKGPNLRPLYLAKVTINVTVL